MNRKIPAITAFMIIFSVIVLHYFNAFYHSPKMSMGRADDSQCVYLTFDDGPSDRVTPKILDVLKEENVKATFFVVGRQVYGREAILKRAFDEGHTIGVHSYCHEYKTIYSSPEALLGDMEKCNDVIESVTGKRSCVYRFPGGSFNIDAGLVNAVTTAGYRYVDWNASVCDAEITNATPYDLIKAAKNTSADRKTVVLLCHDSTTKSATAEALKEIIEYFLSAKYKFCAF